jgi:hypothetical protein
LDAQEVENDFARLLDTLKHRFIHFTKVAFYDVQKADNEFSGEFPYLKHHFREFIQVAIWMPRG